VKVTSCLVLAEAAKRRGSARHLTALRVGEFEVATSGGIWVAIRERRFTLKFDRGRNHILEDIFSWLPHDLPIEQIAVCVTHPKGRTTLGGGRLQSLDEFIAEVRHKVIAMGSANQNAITETYPLLRTLQLTHCGYNRVITGD
jgi:hypothetical protein